MINKPVNRARKFRTPRFGEFADFACWMIVISSIAVAALYVLGEALFHD